MQQIRWRKWLLLLLVNALFVGLAAPVGFLVVILLFGFMSRPSGAGQFFGLLIAVVYFGVWAAANRAIFRAHEPEQTAESHWGKAVGIIALIAVVAGLGTLSYFWGYERYREYTFPWHPLVLQLRKQGAPQGFQFLDRQTDSQLKADGTRFVLYVHKDGPAAPSEFARLREWGARSGRAVDEVSLSVPQSDPSAYPGAQTYAVSFSGEQATDCYPSTDPICSALTGRTWQRDLGYLRDYFRQRQGLVEGLKLDTERSNAETERATDGLVHLYLLEEGSLTRRQVEYFQSALQYGGRSHTNKDVTTYLVQISLVEGAEPDFIFRYQADRRSSAPPDFQQIVWRRCRYALLCNEIVLAPGSGE